MAAADAAAAGQGLQADAFRRLYPEQYYDTFISQGVRTDGRTLGRARAVTIGLRAVGSADSSALVRIGSTTVMAGVRLEVFQPDDAAADRGTAAVAVDMTPLAAPDYRPGKPSDYTHALEQRVSEALLQTGLLDLRQLCISAGQAAWALYLDLCVLDADGSLLDALLLAAVACLRDLRLPSVSVTPEGNVERSAGGGAAGDAMDEGGGGGGGTSGGGGLALAGTPVCLTCGVYKGQLVVDPSREEEALMSSVISVVLDEQAQLMGRCARWALLLVGPPAFRPDRTRAHALPAAPLGTAACRLPPDRQSRCLPQGCTSRAGWRRCRSSCCSSASAAPSTGTRRWRSCCSRRWTSSNDGAGPALRRRQQAEVGACTKLWLVSSLPAAVPLLRCRARAAQRMHITWISKSVDLVVLGWHL
jgi:exosome complex component RRP43